MTLRGAAAGALIVVLLGAVVMLQVLRAGLEARRPPPAAPAVLYVRSSAVVARLALAYESLLADVYWIRTLQHYGRTRLTQGGDGRFELLFPLLDLTTTLDPLFNVAYRFGAIFLAETPPGGPGRPDLAIALLEKGLAAQPQRWEYAQDIGFVHYRTGDYLAAADWFGAAARIPGAPNWLAPLEAVTRTQGGSRASSRQIWTQIAAQAAPEEAWLREQAAFRMQQLDALDQIDAIARVVDQYEARTGDPPESWDALIRARALQGVPIDPAGYPYQLNPWWGIVTLDPQSPLNPLPTLEGRVP